MEITDLGILQEDVHILKQNNEQTHVIYRFVIRNSKLVLLLKCANGDSLIGIKLPVNQNILSSQRRVQA